MEINAENQFSNQPMEFAWTLQRMAQDYRRRGLIKEASALESDTATFCAKNGITVPPEVSEAA